MTKPFGMMNWKPRPVAPDESNIEQWRSNKHDDRLESDSDPSRSRLRDDCRPRQCQIFSQVCRREVLLLLCLLRGKIQNQSSEISEQVHSAQPDDGGNARG